MSRVVVVGASVAAVHVAEALRAGGHTGEVVLLGEEEVAPYDKPALSKEMLTGPWQPEQVSLLPGGRTTDLGLDLRLGIPAIGIDPQAHRVELADDTGVDYDTVVVATGAQARRPQWEVDGVLTLRTLDDGACLRNGLLQARRVVIAGAGFIGAEVAAAARTLGCHVTVVDPASAPLARLVGEEVGAMISDVHVRHGVDTRYGVEVTSVTGRPGNLIVHLADGGHVVADLVVAGLGAVPNDGWLVGSGFPVDNGVLCNEQLQVRGIPDAYAVGDVARWFDRRTREDTRAEHWTNAVEQARHVAANILGASAPYEPLHYVWSDQYDLKLQMLNLPGPRSHHEVIGDLSGAGRGIVAYSDPDGALVAAFAVNDPHVLMNARRMLLARWRFDDAVDTLRRAALKPAR